MKKLWISFAVVLVISFSILGWIGTRIYQEMPPIPAKVVTTDGATVLADGDIGRGQNVWQALGGMEVGSIWGHGSYVAPDWTADWLHREAVFVLEEWASAERGKPYSELNAEEQAGLRGRLEQMYRHNSYNAATNSIVIEPVRARAFEACLKHFSQVFIDGNAAYAIPAGSVRDPERMRQFAGFMFWTAWSAAANRPGDTVSYTHNWPHEPLIGNRPTGESVIWTGVSIIMLLAGICAMVWWYAAQKNDEPKEPVPAADPLAKWSATPSQRATLKYFWVVSALILVQILMGVVTAHYGVEGDGFYGIKLSNILPYSVTRTWHVQIGIFWIATAWLAAGLFIGPLVSGYEPKYQSLGVHVLFGALLVVVAGSMTGEWLSIQNKLSDANSFLWGHQGYEYVDLGRVWQILLFAGLLIWLFLVIRSVRPALKTAGDQRQLLWLFLISAGAIGLFYSAGLTWGQHTHLSIVEYWRWWVVHLWVEGFFEVFATTVIAFFFTRLGLIRPALAAKAALAVGHYLPGWRHHRHVSSPVLLGDAHRGARLGIGVQRAGSGSAHDGGVLRSRRPAPGPAHDLGCSAIKWPIYFFVAVAFWNMVGAGLFGFMINPPIALYFMQGLNTTPLHGHAALFGVYGMLGIGLMLVCLRAMNPDAEWRENWLRNAFWAMNGGLMAMCVGSLLPVGLMQTWASVEHGYWYARSTDFLGLPLMQTLRWMRAPGDTLFAVGALILVGFVFTTRSRRQTVPSGKAVPVPASGD